MTGNTADMCQPWLAVFMEGHNSKRLPTREIPASSAGRLTTTLLLGRVLGDENAGEMNDSWIIAAYFHDQPPFETPGRIWEAAVSLQGTATLDDVGKWLDHCQDKGSTVRKIRLIRVAPGEGPGGWA